MKTVVFLMMLVSLAFAQGEWYYIEDFSKGIQPGTSPAKTPVDAASVMNNFVINGGVMDLRRGYWQIANRFDTTIAGALPSPVHGVRGLYEWYNDVTGHRQWFAVVHDEVWYLDENGTSWQRVGLRDGKMSVANNDSVVLGTNTSFAHNVLPEEGGRWRLYLDESSTIAFEVYKVLSDNTLWLDTPNASGNLSSVDYILTPLFDTTANVDFTSWFQTVFISDGTSPTRLWKGAEFRNSSYIIDSCVVNTRSFYKCSGVSNGPFYAYLTLKTPLTGGPFGITTTLGEKEIAEYGNYHFAVMVFDTAAGHYRRIPIVNETDVDCEMNVSTKYNRIAVFVDSLSYRLLLPNTKLYIVPPMSEGWSFSTDTIFRGTLDSVYYDTAGASSYIYHHMVYDLDSISMATMGTVHNLSTGVYLFKLLSGAKATNPWWVNGAPCYLDYDSAAYGANLGLSVFTPTWGYESPEANWGQPGPLTAGDQYVVVRLNYYPAAKYTFTHEGRLWFAGTSLYPNNVYWSEINDPLDVSPANFEVIGGNDNDEITGVSKRYSYRNFYKRNHIYQLSGDMSTSGGYTIQPVSVDYGLWSSGFLASDRGVDYGLNKLGLFRFDMSSVDDEFSYPVRTFFTDSLEWSLARIVRGVFLGDDLLFSYPAVGSTKNNRSMMLDETGAWTTSSIVGGSYLKRMAPGSLDTVWFGDPDSAKIYAVGDTTTDNGSEIVGTYVSALLDFGQPHMDKQITEIVVHAAMNAGCSLKVSILEDDFVTVGWADSSIVSSLPASKWKSYARAVGPSLEHCDKFAIKIETINADTCRIDMVGLRVQPKVGIGNK